MSSKNTVDKYPCFVGKMKCHNNIKKSLDRLVPTHNILSWLVLRGSCISIYFFQHGLLTLSLNFSHPPLPVCTVLNRSLIFRITWIRTAYPICIQLVTATIFQPYKTLQYPLSDFRLSLVVTFTCYIHGALSSDPDPATSSQGTTI